MKSVLFALSVAVCSSFAHARPVDVKTSEIAPFSCAHAEDNALADLARQCEAIDLVLKQFALGACYKCGDDGGYVEYFTYEASGTCDEATRK